MERRHLYIVILLLVEWTQREKQHGLQLIPKGIFKFPIIRFSLYVIMALFTLLFAGMSAEFIYFQF